MAGLGVRAANRGARGFGEAACFDKTLAFPRAQAESRKPIDSSDNAAIDATAARPLGQEPDQEPDTANVPPSHNPYSAAAVLGRPTKPATSPNRSSITVGRSLDLCVTVAPERTA